ncbi:hypothetical protein ENSA5_36090 [Enhygromyxa salina]|uniref:Uncharacterized protein n=1 Tax=Enhygromyxa salina TaxID=215803 RepID=A0A2S9XUL4_9BACT|nr:ribulose phosphate epimerase [Enhygromyxa salina]PRP96533.1 hypothetical protein ENSA5_36090 [Enhygromyxa salina]
MKTLRLLSLCLIGGALTLQACAKDDQPGTSGAATASNGSGNGDGDGDETGDTSGGEDFGEDDADSGTTTMGFVPDDGDVVGVSECDPWTQDCPDGEKCVAYGSTGGNWDANKCVQVLGDGQPGDPCTYNGTVESTDDCGEDTWCWNVNEDNLGTCTSLCTGSPDDPICEPGYGCSIANEGSITLCLLACDPLLQDCPGTDSCFYDFSGNFVCAFATQDLAEGETCGFINDCVGGTVCLAAEVHPECAGASCCAAFCDVSDPTCLIAGTECQAFFEEGTAPPGYEDVGVCIIPGA